MLRLVCDRRPARPACRYGSASAPEWGSWRYTLILMEIEDTPEHWTALRIVCYAALPLFVLVKSQEIVLGRPAAGLSSCTTQGKGHGAARWSRRNALSHAVKFSVLVDRVMELPLRSAEEIPVKVLAAGCMPYSADSGNKTHHIIQFWGKLCRTFA